MLNALLTWMKSISPSFKKVADIHFFGVSLHVAVILVGQFSCKALSPQLNSILIDTNVSYLYMMID